MSPTHRRVITSWSLHWGPQQGVRDTVVAGPEDRVQGCLPPGMSSHRQRGISRENGLGSNPPFPGPDPQFYRCRNWAEQVTRAPGCWGEQLPEPQGAEESGSLGPRGVDAGWAQPKGNAHSLVPTSPIFLDLGMLVRKDVGQVQNNR